MQCTQCGACCKLAGFAPDFPREYLTASSQACKFLTGDNLCSIYEDRPDVCRVTDSWATQVSACNTLQEYTNTPAKYRLHVLDIN